MTDPAPPAASLDSLADPFGLWSAPDYRALSFSAGEEAPTAVWSVEAADPGALDARERQVRALEAGIAEAEERMDAFIRNQSQTGKGRAVRSSPRKFAVSRQFREGLAENRELRPRQNLQDRQVLERGAMEFGTVFQDPERDLAAAVAALASGASYGLPGNLDIDALRKEFEGWIERANRQLMHFAWVDTRSGGALAARTAVAWNGSVSTTCAAGLNRKLLETHRRSFGLAMTSRVTTLRAVVSVASMAGKISLLIASPLGPLQALLLAAQFLRQIVVPAASRLMAEQKS